MFLIKPASLAAQNTCARSYNFTLPKCSFLYIYDAATTARDNWPQVAMNGLTVAE